MHRGAEPAPLGLDLHERLVGEGEARRGHDDGGDDPQRDEELRSGEQLVEDLEHDVAVAADEVAGGDEGHRDHRHEREFAGADPADRGEVPPEDLIHHAEDDEGEQHDADRDLDRGEHLDELRVLGNALVELGSRVEGAGVPVDGVAQCLVRLERASRARVGLWRARSGPFPLTAPPPWCQDALPTSLLMQDRACARTWRLLRLCDFDRRLQSRVSSNGTLTRHPAQ